ncbi:MAG TPA: hypothetical protein VMY76_08340 [Gemmatimonadales bacterium]|nr:hypothetical protein [Gemmatimonadales bacterium]
MHPRTELALGTGLVLALAVAAGVAGARRARTTDADARRSTFLVGPLGAQGYAEALTRLGIRVETLRRPPATVDSAAAPGTVLAVLGPSQELAPHEGLAFARLRADLLLAGPRAEAAMRCFGYDVRPLRRDSLLVRAPEGDERSFPSARAVLFRRPSDLWRDSTSREDGAPLSCTAPAARLVDTLLRTRGNLPVALRVTMDGGRAVTLVADDRVFTNRALRETAAGPFALALVVPRYSRVIVDEYHHGFDASRSLAGATWSWTLRSPWGWAALQLVGVGALALLVAGIRFGPVRSGIERRRRSPLEHVRALATALAAARGHDVAVGLLVQGLRRRLSRAGRPGRGDIGPWLHGLAPALRTPGGREALDTLTLITTRPASAQEVLQAAHAVETLWEELTPT